MFTRFATMLLPMAILGSQSCEKNFRCARSMSSTFSTMINFDLLDLLCRLHRLHIQFCLEAAAEDTGIQYPRMEMHKKREGTNISKISRTLDNKDILKSVEEGKKAA